MQKLVDVKDKSYKYQVSVIVPCYNIATYLDQCLESLINQTLQAIEIIAINDGSTDNTGSKLDSWQNKYPDKIKVVHHLKNLGLSATRNTGLMVAQGECIGFVDADDYVDLAMYKKLYDASIINNSDIVECGYTQIDLITKQIVNKKNKFNTIRSKKNNILNFLTKGCYVCKCLYKTSFLIQNNIKFNENIYLCEDVIFTYDVLINSPKLSYIKDKLYYYQHGRIGQLTALSGKALYNIFKVFVYINNKPVNYCNEYKLISNFFLHEKIIQFFDRSRKIDKKYRFDFFAKAAYDLFANTKATTIYKVLLLNKYRKPIDYLRVSIYVVISHIYYLFNKFVLVNFKKSSTE